MKSQIKIVHMQEKVSKAGKPYKVFYCVVTIGDVEFFRRFITFG